MRSNNEDLNTSFLQALRDNDSDRVSELIDAGVNVNTADKKGYTSLHWAIKHNYGQIVNRLIEAGADVNPVSVRVLTPLHWAMRHNHGQIVSRLIEAGADANAVDLEGSSPLHWAVCHGNLDAIKELIKVGANVHARTAEKELTPLHWAAYYGDLDVIKELIKVGANVNAKTLGGELTPLYCAMKNGNEQVAAILLVESIRSGGRINDSEINLINTKIFTNDTKTQAFCNRIVAQTSLDPESTKDKELKRNIETLFLNNSVDFRKLTSCIRRKVLAIEATTELREEGEDVANYASPPNHVIEPRFANSIDGGQRHFVNRA